MDWPPMVKREGFACLVKAGVALSAFLPFVVAAGEGQIDAPDVGVRSSFFYWMLDSFMWAVALYYILTRRAAFIELFQRFMLRQDELTTQIDEIELKATELADEYEEIAKHLPNIRGTRHSAKLIGILTAIDAATRRMLDSLPLPSSPAKKDDGGGDSSLSVSREDGEPDAVAPHDVVAQVASSDEGEDSSPAMPAATAAKPTVKGAVVEAQEGSAKEDQHAPTEAEGTKEPPVKSAEENDDGDNNDDQGGGSPIEDSASEKSDLGYTPDSRKTNSLPREDEQEQQSEDDEERPNGSSPGAANALGASAARRKRRLRSRRSVKCRAGEYDDTVGEVDLTRSGSEPDSDASEHRSSDTSVGLGEPLDPSSQFVNEDMRMGGSPSRPHHRKKKEKKPKTRNLKRSSKKMGRSKEVLQSVFTEENERRGANRDESYSEGGDGEGEDQRDKLLRELSLAEAESVNGQGRVDLDALKAELEGASLSEDDKLIDERMGKVVEEDEEDVSDSWRHQKDSSSDESSDVGEAEEKSDFMKLVEEGNDDDDDEPSRSRSRSPSRSRSRSRSRSQSRSRSPSRSRSRSRSPSGSEGEGDDQQSALDSLKAQLDGLDFGDDTGPRPFRSESFTSLQNQLKGLDDLGSFGQLDSLAASAGGESEDEVEQRARRLDQHDDDSSSEEELIKEKEKKDEGSKRTTGLGASPLSSKSSTLKRRSILDVFDNYYEGPGEGQAAQRQQPPAPPVERGDRAVRDIAAREDINVSGLRRAKKTPTTFGSLNRGTKKSIRPQYDMEDAHTVVHPFFEDEGSAFIAVLDGHAGMAVAQEGVKLFPQKLKAHLDAAKPSGHNLEDVLKQTFASVDAELTEHEFVGATATVVFVWTEEGKRYLQAANVGDSAAFLRRGNQTVKLTYDHKVTDEGERERLVGMGVELSAGATRINGLAVSRALGDHFMKENGLGLISEPYVCQPIELTDEDSTLIVASDGLWDVMPGEEAMQIVEGMDSVEDMASCLVRSAVSSSLCVDNVTVVVARL